MRELRRSTFREIKSSFGRFMAIFAIVALGVGFFAGLKVTRAGMTATVEQYLEKYTFYDYRLLSTVGFGQEEAAFLAGQDEVAAAEGSVSFDVLYRGADGGQGAVKTFSITEQVNTLKLTAGRMPEKDTECLADRALFGEEALGSTVWLSEDNDEEDLEHFAYREYEIVGLVQSPLYLQYERGNTSIGTGRLDGYLYLMPGGFDVDYYTEIDVKFERDFELYSTEYSDYIGDKEALWEELTREAAEHRFYDIREEAEEELADARGELEEKKAEGEEELADAARTLEDAKKELADGEQALKDARKELADGERTLQEKERELVDAKALIREKEEELADAEAVIAENETELNDADAVIAQKEQELADAEVLMAEKEAELAEGERQLSEGRAEWERQKGELEAGKDQLAGGRQQLEARRAELEGHRQQLDAALEAGMLAPEEYEAGMAAVAEGERQLEEAGAELDETEAVLAAGEAQLASALQQITETEKALSEGRETFSKGRQELEEGRRALADASRQLSEGWETLLQGKQELEEGRQALAEGRQEAADGEKALADAGKELAEAEETLAEKESEFADAQQEYADGLKEYEDARKEFDEKIADAEAEIADAEQELADLEEPDTYVLGRDTNTGYVCFESDSRIIEGIANIFPVFFFLVAALVCITTMNRMVEEQRTQIGVLKALGYGEAAIMSKYMIYSGLAAVTGCVFGFFLGTWAFPEVIWFCYDIMYSADPIFYVFDWRLAVISLIVSLLCSMGTTWLSCRVELAQVAAVLMRPKAPGAGKRVLLERLPFVWRRLSFLRKVSLRNLFRYKKRLFMMVVGISGCTALLVTGFGIMDSIADVAARQFREIQTYDIGISLNEKADEGVQDRLEELKGSGVGEYTFVMEKNMDLVTERGVKSIYLVAGTEAEMEPFLDLHTTRGEKIAYPALGEAVISNKLAEDYNIGIGDMITLRDGDMNSFTARISAVYENYIYNYVHISEDTWREQMGEEPERKTVYLNLVRQEETEDGFTVHGLSAELMKLDEVLSVTINADTMERIGNMMASLNIIVVVVILCAAGLAFIVLYNLTNINITERVREIATIKVLGFYKKETAAYVFRENIMLTGLGMLLGLGLGYFLHRLVMNEIRVDLIAFHIYVKPVSYLYSALLTFAFGGLVNLFMGGKLESISMTESLKSVD